MSSRILAVAVDAREPLTLARFWSAALHGGESFTWSDPVGTGYVELPGESTLLFQSVAEAKAGKNRLRLDLAPTEGSQAAVVERLTALGATVLDRAEGVRWVVLADPEGNEFCVLPPR